MTLWAIRTGAVSTLLVVATFGPRIKAQGSEGKERTSKDPVVVSETQSESQQRQAAVLPQSGSINLSPDGGRKFSKTRLGYPLLKNIALDQKAIWTSPTHLTLRDADWFVPLAGVTAAFVASDRNFSQALPHSPSFASKSTAFSNYGVASLGGAAGGLYLWGKVTHDNHKREAGLLSGEAAVDALAVTSVLKYGFGRERPQAGNGAGEFWHGGTSFPSDHSTAAWAMASVLAHEYPGTLTKLLVYGLAGAVSASRVTGRDHFPSDVIVGGAIGWFIGQQVYRTHHDQDFGGGSWPTFSELRDSVSGQESGSKGSPYVPLDSWVYPAIERLAALGYVQTEFLGLRPWTRAECAQMVEEAGDVLRQEELEPAEPARFYQELKAEFAGDSKLLYGDDNRALRVESVYTRATDIAGVPLNDSYHFGQTFINNFGRPYAEGFNDISGFSGWASSGRFAIYVRGEFQHAPSAPAYSQSVQDFIAQVDGTPIQPARATPTANQFTLLDTYVTVIVLFCQSQNLYRTVRGRSTLDEAFAVVKAVLLATLLLTAFLYLSGMTTVSRLVIGSSGLFNAIVLAGWRLSRDAVLRRRSGGSGARNTLIVGAGSVGQSLAHYLAENKKLGYAVRGFLNEQNGDSRVLGSPAELASVARAYFIEEVFITIPMEKDLLAAAVLEARRQRLAINVVPDFLEARLQRLAVSLVPDFFDGLGWGMPVRYVGEFPVMELHREPVPVVGLVVKRAMDIVVSAFGLLLAAPVMGAVALVVKLDSHGQVLYGSCRVGRKGRRFICYKFRTMVANADKLKQQLNHLNERQGPLFKISNDPRLTRPGKLLRKYSLDELPQLWNVLKGEMSLVGPRPPVPEECAEYRLECLRRLDVKPGLTGLWQVTARKQPSFETALILDLQYIENWNLWLDLKILLRTLPAVLNGSGA